MFYGQFTCGTSASFQIGYLPIQRVMYSPCVSAAGIRFLPHPFPTEDLTASCELATKGLILDLIGVTLFRISERQWV